MTTPTVAERLAAIRKRVVDVEQDALCGEPGDWLPWALPLALVCQSVQEFATVVVELLPREPAQDRTREALAVAVAGLSAIEATTIENFIEAAARDCLHQVRQLTGEKRPTKQVQHDC